jgi:hypothetical protein
VSSDNINKELKFNTKGIKGIINVSDFLKSSPSPFLLLLKGVFVCFERCFQHLTAAVLSRCITRLSTTTSGYRIKISLAPRCLKHILQLPKGRTIDFPTTRSRQAVFKILLAETTNST